MNLVLSSVSKLYVSDEKLIVVVNPWTEAHDHALIIS